jgi:hypothetical protein
VAEWTPQEDATLHRMWIIEGHSAGFITGTLKGRSRNSIIGRAFRLGWMREKAADAGQRLPYPGTRKGAPAVERKGGRGNSPGSRASLFIGHRKAPLSNQFRAELLANPVESLNARPWTERATGQCAFPVSGEGADTFSCCNATTAVYCAGHQALMYAGSPKVNASHRDDKPQRGLSRSERFFRGMAA